MIHAHDGSTLYPAQIDRNRSQMWGMLSDLEAHNFEPYVTGVKLPVSERQAMDQSAIENFIKGVASRYGVFFLSSSEVSLSPVSHTIKEEI